MTLEMFHDVDHDDSDTGVRFTVQRRPHRSNRNARRCTTTSTPEHKHANSSKTSIYVIFITTPYTRTCSSLFLLHTYNVSVLHASLHFFDCRYRPVAPRAWRESRDATRHPSAAKMMSDVDLDPDRTIDRRRDIITNN